MKKLLFLFVLCTNALFLFASPSAGEAGRKTAFTAKSPNGKIALQYHNGQYQLSCGGQKVLALTDVGVTTTQTGKNLTFVEMKKEGKVEADYEMLAGKKSHGLNKANQYVSLYRDERGNTIRVVFLLWNDGLAFHYELKNLNGERLEGEQTTYRIAEGTKRWMMQWSEGYEGFFPLTTTGEGKNRHWGYPALLQPANDVFALISEANIQRRQSASSLYNDGVSTDYRVCPDQNEVTLNGDWNSPWRVVIVGSLADVVESTLITDVSAPCALTDTSWIEPGVVSWVYWAYNHGSNDYNIIKKYVDFAATLRLPYVLIDAEWDEMKDGKTVEDAVKYATSKGVKPMIWYNSSVGWINGAPGPKFRLNKPEDREKEFDWCERIGVKGVKIDFFSGDNQMNMDYCLDLMESAARHHLLVNFHGATIPRGWQRTYPNLLSTEGVYGAEWYNNVPTFTNKAAAHNATLPFTRNVIGPMDYTPCAFSDSQHPHITTHAHELALTVLFESGLQHLADRPESFLAQPKEVQDFLSQLPAAWDETRFIGGYPGEYAVIARRKGQTWYVAGINGTDEVKSISLDLKNIQNEVTLGDAISGEGRNGGISMTIKKAAGHVTFFADSTDKAAPWSIKQTSVKEIPATVVCQPRGGFIFIINP